MAYAGPTLIGSYVTSASAGAVGVAMPQGLVGGERLLAFFETANETIVVPSGWTMVANSPQGTGTAASTTATRLTIMTREAVAGDSSTVLSSNDPGDHYICRIYAFTASDIEVTAGGTAAASTSGNAPSVTTSGPDRLIVVAVSAGPDTFSPQITFGTNANLVNPATIGNEWGDVGNGGGFGVMTGQKLDAGATGTTPYTLAKSFAKGMLTLALKPKAGAPTAKPTFQAFIIG